MKNSPITTVYMCATDFNYELGNASGGIPVYLSIADLRNSRKCVAECGIVEVEIMFKKVISKGKIY